jgi:hypothetical protein
MFKLFSKNPKTMPKLNPLQKVIVMCTSGFIGRKSRKHYLKNYSSENLAFERQDVKDAISNLCAK